VGRGGSLVAVGDSVVPWGGDAACHDGNCTMVWCNNLYFRRCGVIFTAGKKNHDSGSTVAWGSVAPLPVWSQNHEHVVLMLRIQCQGEGILGDVG